MAVLLRILTKLLMLMFLVKQTNLQRLSSSIPPPCFILYCFTMISLNEKIAYSIDLLRRGERLALALSPSDGYWLAFSGGKDSQVLLSLALRAGVKFRPVYNVTSNDPPENVYFLRKYYPDVEFLFHRPNLYAMIGSKGLPTIHHRWCCAIFKEGSGAEHVVLTGVRREESAKRASYPEIDVRSNRKEHLLRVEPYSLDGLIEANHQCIKGKDKVMLYPLADWTATDVWVYIATEGLPVNPCYQYGGRVGCMFCPFSSRAQLDYYESRYPRFHALFLSGLKAYLKRHRDDVGKVDVLRDEFLYYDWWKSGRTLREYLNKQSQLSMDL